MAGGFRTAGENRSLGAGGIPGKRGVVRCQRARREPRDTATPCCGGGGGVAVEKGQRVQLSRALSRLLSVAILAWMSSRRGSRRVSRMVAASM